MMKEQNYKIKKKGYRFFFFATFSSLIFLKMRYRTQ
jgi:hypothetical protein